MAVAASSRAPVRRPHLLAVRAILALSLGAASAQKKFSPPRGLSAAPPTPFLSGLRKSVTGLARTWYGQPKKTSYSSYLSALRKSVSTLSSTSKQNTYFDNLARIIARNNNTNLRWAAAPNVFTDLNSTERTKFLGVGRNRKSKRAFINALRQTVQSVEAIAAEAPPPAAVAAAAVEPAGLLDNYPEWSIALPDIKSQGGCSACWAFVATAMTEAGHYVNTGEVLPLSEKQLVDCNFPANGGCDGGYLNVAFNYIIASGLPTADLYPYTAWHTSCPANLPPAASRLAAWKQLPTANEAAMLEALKDGPIAVSYTVDDAFYSYGGGVYSSTNCSSEVNHALVIVGAGVDDETKVPYWLVRNSWGFDWGEGGYARIQRGVGGNGTCQIAVTPYQVLSADHPSPPPPQPPAPGCQPTNITVKANTSLADVARQYKVSISQIMLDNKLDSNVPFKDGQSLLINCPTGNWSQPYGVWDNKNTNNAMSAIPTVAICPAGSFAVSFYVRPSKWFNGASVFTGTTWVGTIHMTCSDGSFFTLDAQPGFNPGWADGTQTQITGFTNVTLSAGWAVDSLFGVGVLSGGEKGIFACPADQLVTGISGGSRESYPQGFVNNLQFLCQNPFGQNLTKVRALRSVGSRYPRIRTGLSCVAYNVSANDTWTTVAAKYRVGVLELMRSNPSIAGATLPVGQFVFIPPCVNGVLHGTKVSKKGVVAGAEASAAAAAAAAVVEGGGISSSEPSNGIVPVPAIAPGTDA